MTTSFADITTELNEGLEHDRICAEWVRVNSENTRRLAEWLNRVKPAMQRLVFSRKPLSELILSILSPSSGNNNNNNNNFKNPVAAAATPFKQHSVNLDETLHHKKMQNDDDDDQSTKKQTRIHLGNTESGGFSTASSVTPANAAEAAAALHHHHQQQRAFTSSSVSAIDAAFRALPRSQKELLEFRLCGITLISDKIFTTHDLSAGGNKNGDSNAFAPSSCRTYFFNANFVPADISAVHNSVAAALTPAAMSCLVPLVEGWLDTKLAAVIQRADEQEGEQQQQRDNNSKGVPAPPSFSSAAAAATLKKQKRNSELEVHWRRRRAMALALLSTAVFCYNNPDVEQKQHLFLSNQALRPTMHSILRCVHDLYEEGRSACVPLKRDSIMDLASKITEILSQRSRRDEYY